MGWIACGPGAAKGLCHHNSGGELESGRPPADKGADAGLGTVAELKGSSKGPKWDLGSVHGGQAASSATFPRDRWKK